MNKNTEISMRNDFTLDEKSKADFLSKINPEILTAIKSADNFDPTTLLKYNNGEYYIKADDLICWLKIVYPHSDIQLEKIIIDDEKCQYSCKIWRTPEAVRPTVAEGSLVYRNDSGEPYQWRDNYVSSAETMAIIRCIKLLGIGSQCRDEYYVEKVNNNPNPAAPADSKITVETAKECIVQYIPEYKGEKKYEGEKLGDVKAKDIRHFREISLKTCYTPYVRDCATFLMKIKE